MKQYNVAVAGVTGAVGSEMLKVLERRQFPVAQLKPLASERSAGKQVAFAGKTLTIEELNERSFEGMDIALFATDTPISRQFAPAAAAAGAVVIDNSSAYRMDPNCPLIVPEVNADAMRGHQGIIANPNCVAAILTVGINPLRQLANFRRLVISTYQSTSGAGAPGMQELWEQTKTVDDGGKAEPKFFQYPIAFNLFSHNTKIEENGYNGEENKVIKEARRILELPELAITVTCVRVPVLRAHSMAVNIEFDRPVDVQAARDVLANAPGVKLQDDRENNHFPMPLEVSEQNDVEVGRIRQDLSCPNALDIFIAGDQLLKGAALNAVQIAEMWIAQHEG
jgi:aspartate-semialdehyde dehydrogenase